MRDRGKTRAWEKNRWMEKKYKKKRINSRNHESRKSFTIKKLKKKDILFFVEEENTMR